MKIRYVHTNLIAADWRRLADFYINVFGCVEKKPGRDLRGEWLDRATGLPDVRIRGAHLSLPGFPEGGPTLEVFQYDRTRGNDARMTNTEGFGHIAFAVDDVDACVASILAEGGSLAGETVRGDIPGVGRIHMAYARDPEGNIIEVQRIETTG